MCFQKSEGISHLNKQQSFSGGNSFPPLESFVSSQRKKTNHKILGNANQNCHFLFDAENVISSYIYLWFLIFCTISWFFCIL